MPNYDITKSYNHPLFLDEIPEDETNDAIEAIKLIHSEGETPNSIAIHYNNLAKEYIQDKAKGYLENALSCYNKGIESQPSNPKTLSLLHSNRAHVFLLMGKHVQCVDDCRKAIRYDSGNAKAYYRGAKASLGLELYKQGLEFCEEYKRIFDDIKDQLFLILYDKLAAGEKFFSDKRSEGKKSYEHIKKHYSSYSLPEGVESVHYIKDGIAHFSSIFIYDEIAMTDYIIDMADTDTIQMHLDDMFNESGFEGVKFNKEVVVFAELPDNKLLRVDTSIPIGIALKNVTRVFDVLPLHILRDNNVEEKIQRLLEGYKVIE